MLPEENSGYSGSRSTYTSGSSRYQRTRKNSWSRSTCCSSSRCSNNYSSSSSCVRNSKRSCSHNSNRRNNASKKQAGAAASQLPISTLLVKELVRLESRLTRCGKHTQAALPGSNPQCKTLKPKNHNVANLKS